MNNPETRFKIMLQLIVVAAVAVIGYFSYIAISRHGKISTAISTLPTYAEITLQNGKSVHNGINYLAAGTYQATVSADGFTTKTTTFTVNQTRNSYAVILDAQSAAAKKWLSDNSQAAHDVEAVSDAQSSQDTDVFNNQNPIANFLPYNDTYYSIGYIGGSGKTITITVHTASPRFRYEALKQIASWGYDISTLNIDFVDYHNPLGS